MFAPVESYSDRGDFALIAFDLRLAGAVERVHRERAFWQGDCDIEMLDFDHAVLVIKPRGVGRVPA
jgi:hypothetical protein